MLSIVGFGVTLFSAKAKADPGAAFLVFGTSTTAKVAAHQKGMGKKGNPMERVVMWGCPKLETNIQLTGAKSDNVKGRLDGFVDAAWQEMEKRQLSPPVSAVYAGMCCTHYGYSAKLWTAHLAELSAASAGKPTTAIINPNVDMAAYIFVEAKRRGMAIVAPADVTVTSFDVLSRLPFTTEIDSIAPLLCDKAGQALRNYTHDPNLCFDHPIVLGGVLGDGK